MVKVVPARPECGRSCENCSKQRERASHVPSRAERDDEQAEEHDTADDDIPENHQGLPWRKRTTVNRQLWITLSSYPPRSAPNYRPEYTARSQTEAPSRSRKFCRTFFDECRYRVRHFAGRAAEGAFPIAVVVSASMTMSTSNASSSGGVGPRNLWQMMPWWSRMYTVGQPGTLNLFAIGP
jgi:hypothetical protein